MIYEAEGWQIDLSRRELRANGATVPVGDRAFGIIEALVRSAGALVTKRELMNCVWPAINVEENTLQVHVSALRKAFGKDRALLQTVPGRGYRLLGGWAVKVDAPAREPGRHSKRQITPSAPGELPVRGNALIGRENEIEIVLDHLSAYRVLTLVGPGGIGKTRLAIEAARRSAGKFQGDIRLVDFVTISDPSLVPALVADALGLKLAGQETSANAVTRAIGYAKLLLIFDNCEHVIESVAAMASAIMRSCGGTTVLATSRELLRIEGEYVYRVSSLEVPLPAERDVDRIRRCAAVELLITNMGGLRPDFSPDADQLVAISVICRRLDGIPLAIEFAAGRVATLGVHEVAAHLDDRFELLTTGRRTALPRHRTLRAIFDWSFDLLSEIERAMLRRLAVFVGPFSLAAARAVAAFEPIEAQQVAAVVAELVAKSLVANEPAGGHVKYRLLETTRAYLLTKAVTSGEQSSIARRHAAYYCDLLEQTGFGASIGFVSAEHEAYREILGNIRVGLEWCFSDNGDVQLGARLAAASAPLFLELSLLTECQTWSERALAKLGPGAVDGRREMALQTSLALSLMFTAGNSKKVRAAYERGLDLARRLNDPQHELRLLSGLHVFLTRTDFSGALALALRSDAVAKQINDPASRVIVDWMLGVSYHLSGNQVLALSHSQAALSREAVSQSAHLTRFGYDHRIRALVNLARTLWVAGFPDQAMAMARQTLAEADTLDHPVSLCICLVYAVGVFWWAGATPAAEEIVERLIAHADQYSLAPYKAVGEGFKGEFALQRGDLTLGVDLLRASLETLHEEGHEIFTYMFSNDLAEGLAARGQLDQALAVIDANIERDAGQTYYTPEVWRTKGKILASVPEGSTDEAETWLLRSMAMAGNQLALSWELRAAVTLARLKLNRGRRNEGRRIVETVYRRFTEGFASADLSAARAMLTALGSRAGLG